MLDAMEESVSVRAIYRRQVRISCY